jgi:HEAT repeat protein
MSGPGGDPAARHARAAHTDEETRYRAVGELDADDRGDRRVLLERLGDPSWRVRAAAVERIAAGRGAAETVAGLVAILDAGPSVGARESAAAALARIGAPALPALIERLGAPDPDLRQAAAGVLGAIADGRAVPPLAARLADPDPNVRGAAAEALGKIGGAGATASLRAAADSDDATLRLTALEALGALNASLRVARIEQLLGDRALRRPLYRLLGSSDDPAALALVARGLSDAARVGRDAALGALGRQRSRRSAEELAPLLAAARSVAAREPGLADAWAAALVSEDPFVAIGALTVLAAAGAAHHAGAMVKLAEDERYRVLVEDGLEALLPGPELRTALADALPSLGQLARITALSALARLGSPAAFETVVREASDRDSYVQAEAIAALGRLRDARGVAPLAGLLGPDDAAAAGLACASLVRIAQSGAAERQAVLAAVRARGGSSPCAAVYRAVGALGAAEDVPFVTAGLASPSAADRAAAAGAIAAFAQRGVLAGAVPALAGALSDPAGPVRAAAARALAELARVRARSAPPGEPPDEEPVRAVRAALRDPEPAVRAAAAGALGAYGRPEHAPDLAALADDPEAPPPVVLAALRALKELGRLGGAALARALLHPDPEVVKEAVLCAARVPGADGERILRAAAASARWDVRRAAARAIAERADPALLDDARRLAAEDPDPLVARAFEEAARALGSP